MKWSRKHTLIAGVALIALTNATVLGGAAYNRSGEAESMLRLSERELRPPHIWRNKKENSGLGLRLRWRVLQAGVEPQYYYRYGYHGGGDPDWLDEAKMASLGFDVTLSNVSNDDAARRGAPYQRQFPRDVLVVLELDGPVYRESLERAAKAAKEVEKKNERGEGAKLAAEMIERETKVNSRLFAVDAGQDLALLRAKHPDRSRYAIVRGQVRPTLATKRSRAGHIGELSADEIHVPLELRGVFEGADPDPGPKVTERYEATVFYGNRLEPWIVSAAKK